MNTTLSCGACTATLIRPIGAPHTQGPRRSVAVSGGIGSGKSSVTRVFASRGAVTADADAIARQILEPGEPTLSEVARAFGGDLLKEDGSLDRALLASRVFGGEGASERVARLNAITHPVIEARAWSILRGAPEGSLAVYDIPLLIEGDHVERFDAVVIVDAPIEERVKRLEGRGVAPEDARARIRAQASSEERRAIATIWIDNEGSAEDLEEVARLVYERWLTPDAPVTV
ncbi:MULTISPECIES: dephospho-CoA kinase [Micrococcales]|uniref:dephospho-CoA kinase n=1 Tax=Micrococcales TaxID=85006 RepID=UPI00080A8F38|nr:MULTISPECIES: dephospho-CoA kinase [Micrococcales]